MSAPRRKTTKKKKKGPTTQLNVFWAEEPNKSLKYELVETKNLKIDELTDSARDKAVADTIRAVAARKAFDKKDASDPNDTDPKLYGFACDLCGAARLDSKGQWIYWMDHSERKYRDVCASCYNTKAKDTNHDSYFRAFDFVSLNEALSQRFRELKKVVTDDLFWEVVCWPATRIDIDSLASHDALYDKLNDAHQRYEDGFLKRDEEADEIEPLAQRSISPLGHRVSIGVATVDLLKEDRDMRLFGLVHREPTFKAHFEEPKYEDQFFLRLGNRGLVGFLEFARLSEHEPGTIQVIMDQYRVTPDTKFNRDMPFTSSVDLEDLDDDEDS